MRSLLLLSLISVMSALPAPMNRVEINWFAAGWYKYVCLMCPLFTRFCR